MRKLTCTLILCCSALIICCQKAPIFTCGNTIDYGLVEFNSPNSTRSITFTNTGNAPIILTSVKSSCGCLVPVYYPKNPVPPNQSDSIVVKYDTKRPGLFYKTITVTTNEVDEQYSKETDYPIYKNHVIKVIGEVKPAPVEEDPIKGKEKNFPKE
jgi:hypothetical protein